jgi:ArsR family transcriptional regulator
MMTLTDKNHEAERIAAEHPYPEQFGHQLATMCRVLGDETRLRILYFLQREKEINVRTFCELVSQSQPAVSHHLALLREAGLVESRRSGKNNYYHFVPARARALLDQLLGVASHESKQWEIDGRTVQYALRAHNGPGEDCANDREG